MIVDGRRVFVGDPRSPEQPSGCHEEIRLLARIVAYTNGDARGHW
jgi:hypothetical protein